MSIWTKQKTDYVADVKEVRNHVYDITEDDYAVGKSNGLSRELVYKRVWKGMTVEDAISRQIGNKTGEGPWNEWKGKSEVCRSTFYRNLNNGLSPEEAIKKRRIG